MEQSNISFILYGGLFTVSAPRNIYQNGEMSAYFAVPDCGGGLVDQPLFMNAILR